MNKQGKNHLKTGVFLLWLVIMSGIQVAKAAPQTVLKNTPPLLPYDTDNEFFYEIGGGTNYRLPGGVEKPLKKLYLNKDFALILSADDVFKPFQSITNILNNLLDEIKTGIVNIAQGYITALGKMPGYVLCRSNPLLCQQFENYSIRAEEKVRNTTDFIHDMERQVEDVRGNLEGWFKAGKAGRLITAIKEAKAAGKDLEDVAKRIKKYTGKEGLKWIGGQLAGGDGMRPIRPIADTMVAGFNLLLDRKVTDESQYKGKNPLADFWDTPEEAAKWLVDVVGEFRPDINNHRAQKAPTSIALAGKDDGDGGMGGEDVRVDNAFVASDISTPARGLAPKIIREKSLIVNQINTLLSKSKLTQDDLTQMMGKSSNVVLTKPVLNLIKNSSMSGVIMNQVAGDAAQSNVLRYSLAARRMLIAGQNEPHIASYKIATAEIDKKIKALDANIDAILYERRISKELLSDTVTKLLKYSKKTIEKNSVYSPKPWQPTFGEGGIKQ